MDYIIVGVVVLVAAFFAGKRVWAALHGQSDCGCHPSGCSGCSCSHKEELQSEDEAGGKE